MGDLQLEVSFIPGHWRTAQPVNVKHLKNEVIPDLSVVAFQLQPLVFTLNTDFFNAVFFVSEPSLRTQKATWTPTGGRSRNVDLRPANEMTYEWLRLQIARAQGKKFRSHNMAGNTVYDYTP
jgi:hypothetical protein